MTERNRWGVKIEMRVAQRGAVLRVARAVAYWCIVALLILTMCALMTWATFSPTGSLTPAVLNLALISGVMLWAWWRSRR